MWVYLQQYAIAAAYQLPGMYISIKSTISPTWTVFSIVYVNAAVPGQLRVVLMPGNGSAAKVINELDQTYVDMKPKAKPNLKNAKSYCA